MRSIARFLAATPVLALLTVVSLPAAAQEPPADLAAIGSSETLQTTLLEPRWLPWLGCWELTADAVDYREVESTGRRVVCVAPRLDGRGVNLTTQIDTEVITENTVIADGAERALPEADCNGHQTATWSADGRRLHTAVSASCGDEAARTVRGLNMLGESGRWIELQSVSLDGGDNRELVVRHYERLDDQATRALGYATLGAELAARAAQARAAAAAALDVDDVIEAYEIFPVELVEAAILESNSMFALDTGALVRLADAGLEDRVIDLMVAVSFPDQFVVDAEPSYSGGAAGTGWVGYYGYYHPTCWGRYYSPFYGMYGPGGCGYYVSPYAYYGDYYTPYYYSGGRSRSFRPRVPASGSLYGGRVINKRGYSVSAPGSSPTSGTVSISERAGSSGLGYTVRRAIARDGGGGAGIFGGKRSNSGGVSRIGGFKPSSVGGGSASGGSSSGSGGGTVRTAKPRGGGGGKGSGG